MESGEGPGWDLSPPAKQALYSENAHGQPAKSRAASAQPDAEKTNKQTNKKKKTWDWCHSHTAHGSNLASFTYYTFGLGQVTSRSPKFPL